MVGVDEDILTHIKLRHVEQRAVDGHNKMVYGWAL
jgi:hypothetical protein